MQSRLDLYSKCVLTFIAVFLGILAFRPAIQPTIVSAQSDSPYYVEPGTTLLRKPDGSQQVQGKVIINLNSGEVWGFPTQSSTPYPVDIVRSRPPVADPMYLGKFNIPKIQEEREKLNSK